MTALSRSRFWGRQAVPKMEPRKRRMDIPCTHRRHEKCFSKHPCDAHVSKFIPEHGRPRTVKPDFGWFSAPKNGTLKDNRNISRTELHHRFYCDTTATRICCLFPRAPSRAMLATLAGSSWRICDRKRKTSTATPQPTSFHHQHCCVGFKGRPYQTCNCDVKTSESRSLIV